jgi:serine/threonine protein kinase
LTDFYDIKEPLGKGKFGLVKSAIHKKTGKNVAVKIMSKKEMTVPDIELQRREIEILKMCQHPYIIRLLDIFENEDNIYIVMENLSGGDLFTYMEKRKFTVTEHRAKTIAHQIATSLYYLHSFGICHRDLKPANLFVMPTGEVKIIDFGESKDYFREGEDGGDAATATIRGTPQYLSPILWKAHVVDGNSRFAKHNIFKSDVFSIGLMFYQLSSMEDVTGFNQKTADYDGEKLIEAGVKRLK